MKLKLEKIGNTIISSMIIVFLSMQVILYNDASVLKIVILFCVPLLIIMFLFYNHCKLIIVKNVYFMLLLLFIVYGWGSSLWAKNKENVLDTSLYVLELNICCFVVYMFYSLKDSIDEIINVMICWGYFIAVDAFFRFGIDMITQSLMSGGRIEQMYSNLNLIGMQAALSIVLSFYKCKICREKKWYYLFFIPALVVIIVTQSKKAVVLLILGIFLVLLKIYWGHNLGKRLIGCVLLLAGIIGIVFIMQKTPLLQGITERFFTMFKVLIGESADDKSTAERKALILIGLRSFTEHPIWGIGFGNGHLINKVKDTYLHCNYVELLVNGGIIGFALYYFMWIYPLVFLLKNRRYDEENSFICAGIIILVLVTDIACVSYILFSTYIYLIVIYLQVKNVSKIKNNLFARHYNEKNTIHN